MRLKRLVGSILVLFVMSSGPAVAVSAPPLAQGDNAAVVQNTKDGSSVFRFAFNIRRVMNETVDVDNAAVAVASCDSCRTVAIAISVVLIFSDPDVVTTDNLALALNYECNLCETMALAYQLVLTTDGPVYFTGETNQTINDLIRQIREIGASDLPLAEIDAQVSALVDELFAVVRASMEEAAPPQEDGDAATSEASPSPSTAPSPAESSTPTLEPSETATPEPETSPAPEPSPSA